jgi:WD40 repeat protein/tRNA A-37 threonylcarbamoyl transferase component Bud32
MSDTTIRQPSPEEQFDAVLADYLESLQQGQRPQREAFLLRYPQLADQLRAYFADEDHFCQAVHHLGGLGPSCSASPPVLDTNDLPTEQLSQDGVPPEAPASSGLHEEQGSLASPQSEPLSLPPAIGKTFAHYDQLEEIARGGMGVVYRARGRRANRIVALKMIRAGHLASREEVLRFRQEAEATAKLQHPHIVPIYEVGEHEGHPYFTMKFISGGSLAHHLGCYLGKPRAAARLLATVAGAVHYAHQRQILHRDLKPANILLEGDPRAPIEDLVPHVTDLGLAKHLEESGLEQGLPPTRTGDIVGTPCYMAPEQARGERNLTTAVDIYSLGAILYEMLTGRPPFQEATSVETVMRAMHDTPIAPRQINRRIPRDLETITLKCLEKKPASRYASADALANDLERWLSGRPIHARRTHWPERLLKWGQRRPLVAALILLVFLVAALGFAGVVWRWQAEARLRQELARTLYVQTIALAERELSTDNVPRAEEMLHGPGCPPELRGWEWRYLDQMTHPHVPTLLGHQGAIFSVAASPDGQILVSAGGKGGTGEALVWDANTGKQLAAFGHREGEHTGWIRGLDFHPQGRLLASAASDGTVILWDTRTWKPWRRLLGHTVLVWCVAFNQDGTLLASAGGGKSPDDDGEIFIWETRTGKLRHQIPRHRDRIWRVAFHPEDSSLLASAGEDKKVRLWRLGKPSEQPRQERVFEGLEASAVSLAFSPDGTLLASGSGTHHTGDPAVIKVWNVHTGAEVATLHGHTNEIWGLTFTPDGSRVVSASHDQTIKFWDLHNGRETLTLRAHSDNVRAVTFLGDRLVSVSEDHTVKLWEPTPVVGKYLAPRSLILKGHQDRVWCVAYRADGKMLASAGRDHTIRIWEVDLTGKQPSYRLQRTLTGHEGTIRAVCFSPTEEKLASASYDNTVRIWDLPGGKSMVLTAKEMGWVHGVAFSPDGKLVAGVSNYTVRLWQVSDGQAVTRRLPQHEWVVSSLAFRPFPEGNQTLELATGSWDQTIQLWDVGQGKFLRRLEGHRGRVQCLAFRPDGQQLATAGNEGVIKLWDVQTGTEVRSLTGHNNAVVSLAYGPGGPEGKGGSLLASACRDQTVRLWDPETGQELLTLRGHPGPLHGIAFHPQGKHLAVACGNTGEGAIKVWLLPPIPSVGR